MLQEIGAILAVGGASLTVIGTLVNNIQNKHWRAKKIWAVSNPTLAVWAGGYIAGLWAVDLTMAAILIMYLIFTVTNWYCLWKGSPLEAIEAMLE